MDIKKARRIFLQKYVTKTGKMKALYIEPVKRILDEKVCKFMQWESVCNSCTNYVLKGASNYAKAIEFIKDCGIDCKFYNIAPRHGADGEVIELTAKGRRRVVALIKHYVEL